MPPNIKSKINTKSNVDTTKATKPNAPPKAKAPKTKAPKTKAPPKTKPKTEKSTEDNKKESDKCVDALEILKKIKNIVNDI